MSPELNCSFCYIAKIAINIQNSLTPFIPKNLVQFRIDRRIYTMNFAGSVIFYDTNMLEVMFEHVLFNLLFDPYFRRFPLGRKQRMFYLSFDAVAE